jgi:hypothetical protein
MPETTTSSEEVLEAGVRGPDGANTLFSCNGFAQTFVSASDGENAETFTFLVGPTISRSQFRRASATAFVSTDAFSAFTEGLASYNSSISSVEADWDDQAQRVRVRVEIRLAAGPRVTYQVQAIRYSVIIIAQM